MCARDARKNIGAKYCPLFFYQFPVSTSFLIFSPMITHSLFISTSMNTSFSRSLLAITLGIYDYIGFCFQCSADYLSRAISSSIESWPTDWILPLSSLSILRFLFLFIVLQSRFNLSLRSCGLVFKFFYKALSLLNPQGSVWGHP